MRNKRPNNKQNKTNETTKITHSKQHTTWENAQLTN